MTHNALRGDACSPSTGAFSSAAPSRWRRPQRSVGVASNSSNVRSGNVPVTIFACSRSGSSLMREATKPVLLFALAQHQESNDCANFRNVDVYYGVRVVSTRVNARDDPSGEVEGTSVAMARKIAPSLRPAIVGEGGPRRMIALQTVGRFPRTASGEACRRGDVHGWLVGSLGRSSSQRNLNSPP